MSKASLELGGGNWATKDGNLLGYAQGNESSKFVPREFTFTRGSDIAATRINSSGLIEKYRENLLLQSNQFDTTWTLSSTSVTSGQSGYDGSSDAWLLNSTTTGFPRIEQNVTSSGVATYSVYAKAATDGFILMRTFGADSSVWFNLTDGLISNASGSQYITSNIQSVGNGWYRCSVTFNGSLTSARIYPSSAYGTYSTSGNGVYIQDAQLEKGLVATSYLESGATTATSGVADNEPRIDYAGGTASLLLEPQRTNLITQSEYFGGYTNSSSTDESNAITSPEGLTNATSFLEAATTGQHKLTTSFGFDGTSTYTFSVFAKHNGRDLFIDTQNSNEWGGRAWFDLTTGTANAVLGTANIEDYGNGWYRCIVTGASTLAGNNFIELLTSDGSNNSTTGDITKGVYIYGAQLEEGSYPTSYIPTYGTSDTRNADFPTTNINTNITDSTQGSVYFEFQSISSTSTDVQNYFTLNTGTSDSIRFGVQSAGGIFRAKKDGVNLFSQGFAITDPTAVNKIAFRWGLNDWKLYLNGSVVYTSTSMDTFESGDLTKLENGINNALGFLGNVRELVVFPTALTDRELVDLTSPYSTYQELVTAEGLTWESPTCTTNSITELQSI